jgi:hypothetical protein
MDLRLLSLVEITPVLTACAARLALRDIQPARVPIIASQ